MRLLLMMLLVVVSNSTMAEWKKVIQTPSKGMYVDPTTISYEGNIAKAWILEDIEKVSNGSPYMSLKWQMEFDCKEKQDKTLSLTSYSGHMGGGIASVKPISSNWEPIQQGSVGEILLKNACLNLPVAGQNTSQDENPQTEGGIVVSLLPCRKMIGRTYGGLIATTPDVNIFDDELKTRQIVDSLFKIAKKYNCTDTRVFLIPLSAKVLLTNSQSWKSKGCDIFHMFSDINLFEADYCLSKNQIPHALQRYHQNYRGDSPLDFYHNTVAGKKLVAQQEAENAAKQAKLQAQKQQQEQQQEQQLASVIAAARQSAKYRGPQKEAVDATLSSVVRENCNIKYRGTECKFAIVNVAEYSLSRSDQANGYSQAWVVIVSALSRYKSGFTGDGPLGEWTERMICKISKKNSAGDWEFLHATCGLFGIRN